MPIFDYADFAWAGVIKTTQSSFKSFTIKQQKIIVEDHLLPSASESRSLLNWQLLPICRYFHRGLIMHKFWNSNVYFKFNFQCPSDTYSYNNWKKQNLHLEHVKKNWGKQAFAYHAANDWNSVPVELREIELFTSFKIKLKKHFTQ